jgi:SAM-dependent methyltransferase
MHAATRAVLACPDCRNALGGEGDTLVCEGCGRRFPVEAGVPRLLPKDSLGAAWEEKQALGESEYEDGPPDTALAERFGRFAEVEGLVVDVGSGVEPQPAYLGDREGRTVVRVDPLVGEAPSELDFVQGVAERLPFRDASFDGAISATMLDHVPDPRRALEEIRRVVRPGGRLAVWIGVVDEAELKANALGNLALPERRSPRALIREHGVAGTASRAFRHLVWNRARAAATTLRLRFARRRVVAEVYADRARYHFSFFEADDVLELLRQTRFRVLSSVRVETDGAGTSLFVLAEAVD